MNVKRIQKNFLLRLFLTILISVILCASLTAQSSDPQVIDVYFKYGNPDFLDLSGQKVISAGSKVYVENLESFAIGYSAWNLMGEFVYSPSFYYAINSERLKGSAGPVYYRVISKYPDLAKRYQAIRPTSVDIKLNVQLKLNYDTSLRPVSFRITNNDLVYFESGSGKNYKSPTSPKRWQDAFSNDQTSKAFTAADSSEERILIELLKKQVAVMPSVGGDNVVINVKWDVGAIDEIGRLYDQYEKENKKIDDELKAVKNADKLIKPVAAYNKDDEMSAPFEEEAKSAEVFQDGKTVGLRAKGKVVFTSSEYSSAEPINSEKSLFKFNSRKNDWHLYNAKGKRLSVNGEDKFYSIKAGDSSGTYELLVLTESSPSYTSRYKHVSSYSSEKGYHTQSEVDRYLAREKPQDQCPNCKSGEVFIALPEYPINFFRAKRYEVDTKMNVLASEAVYISTSQSYFR